MTPNRPRHPRQCVDDGIYHLIARGNNRQFLRRLLFAVLTEQHAIC